MLIDVAIGVIALAVLVLVAVLVPVLSQVRRTAQEAERLLLQLNDDMPGLLQEATAAVRHLNAAATNARDSAAQVRGLGDALGTLRSGAGALVSHVRGWMAGLQAMVGAFKQGARPSPGERLPDGRKPGTSVVLRED